MAAAPTVISKPGSARDTFIENGMRFPVAATKAAARSRHASASCLAMFTRCVRLSRVWDALFLIAPRLGFPLGFELSGQLP